jgi:hypothetical protein
MPADDSGTLAALLPETVAALIAAQHELDERTGTFGEEQSGTRFHLTSIPSAELRLSFGVSISQKRGFIVSRRATGALRHQLSLTLHAVPEPIAAPPPGQWGPTAFTLFEPGFMLDPEREIDLGAAVCDALGRGACIVNVPEPQRVDPDAIRKAGATLREQLLRPEHPELGVVAFRVAERPDTNLVVIVTDKAKRDGVFIVEAGRPPVAYSIPGDRNDAMFYEPLHRLTMAVGAWLGGAASRRRAGAARLPREWGFTTLEVFADALVSGYQQCVELLAAPRLSGPLTQQFDLARVRAEVAFGIRQGGAPAITIAQETGAFDELIFGQMLIELERLPRAVGVTLTLLAPGYVLAARARDAFVTRAQRIADAIAREFEDDPSLDYALAIREPYKPAEIVAMLATDHPDDPFTYVVTWPVRTPDGERHFVFRCVEDDDSLDDIEALVRASDRVGAVSIASAPAASVDEDVYEAYNRFFRAARVWRSGVSHDAQRARLMLA